MDQAVELAKRSDSTIIVLLVVLAIIFIAFIPVIKTIASISTNRRQQDYERETRLIQVIEKNTEVNSALKIVIESDQKFCNDCRKEQMNAFRQLQDNQDVANMKLVEIHSLLKKEAPNG